MATEMFGFSTKSPSTVTPPYKRDARKYIGDIADTVLIQYDNAAVGRQLPDDHSVDISTFSSSQVWVSITPPKCCLFGAPERENLRAMVCC